MKSVTAVRCFIVCILSTLLTSAPAPACPSDADEESESQEEDERELVQYLISNQVHFTSAKMNR